MESQVGLSDEGGLRWSALDTHLAAHPNGEAMCNELDSLQIDRQNDAVGDFLNMVSRRANTSADDSNRNTCALSKCIC